MFAVLRICRVLTGRNLVPQHFSIAHHRSRDIAEMARFVGTKMKFDADTDEFALDADARELPLIHADSYLNDLLLKHCEAALADRRGEKSQLRTRVENAISSVLPHGRVLVPAQFSTASRKGGDFRRPAVPSRSWGRFSPPLFRSSPSVFAAAPRWKLS